MVLEFWITYYSWQGVPEKEREGNFWGSSNDMGFFNIVSDYTGRFTS